MGARYVYSRQLLLTGFGEHPSLLMQPLALGSSRMVGGFSGQPKVDEARGAK